jgi:hypothetical protein
VIARNEYTKTEEKNPVDCALFYLALKKKAVLVGLWRMATWSREQHATHRLLSNNFNEERWKTAALKNAYALMGKRRFEYAASFFLLADRLQDAVSVLSNQMNDTQLAIAVARVYEGDDGPVLRTFLKDKILPQAARDGNRWLATWAFWMINRRDNAVRSLVTPLSTLLSPPETPNFKSKSYLTDDPALVVLYKQLREKSLQTLRGATMVGMREEWDFVLHTARLYQRMGCDLLSLDLGKFSLASSPPYLFCLYIYNICRVENVNADIYLVQSKHGSFLPHHPALLRRVSSHCLQHYRATPSSPRARTKALRILSLIPDDYCGGAAVLLLPICLRENMQQIP